jgi:hypothetical protein
MARFGARPANHSVVVRSSAHRPAHSPGVSRRPARTRSGIPPPLVGRLRRDMARDRPPALQFQLRFHLRSRGLSRSTRSRHPLRNPDQSRPFTPPGPRFPASPANGLTQGRSQVNCTLARLHRLLRGAHLSVLSWSAESSVSQRANSSCLSPSMSDNNKTNFSAPHRH